MTADRQRQSPLLTIYLERRGELVRHFRVRLRSEERAEELVQEIYLKIAGHNPDVSGAIENSGAYLYRVGTNLMLDLIKQERRAARKIDAFGAHLGAAANIEPATPADDALAARQHLGLVIAAVRKLPKQAQEAFRLHKLEGLSHAQTAAAMGVSRSSVEKYLMACLREIAKMNPRGPQ